MLHQSIQEFTEGWVTRARLDGLASGNPLKYKVLGSAVSSGKIAVSRTIIVSFEPPSLPTTSYPVLIWVNANTLGAFKSTNWRDASPSWEEQSDWSTLFEDIVQGGDGGQLSGATLTSPLYLIENPIAGNEAVTKAYVDNLVATINAGGSPEYGPPVATLEVLKALDVSLVPTGQIRYVESMADIYGYSPSSSLAADGIYIVQPTSGPGRWLSVSANNVTGGTF